MTLDEFIAAAADAYDWTYTFDGGYYDKSPVIRSTVATIERHWSDPDADEWEGCAIGRTHDGEWWTISGWCDYTGWDCQSGVTWETGPLDHVWRNGLTDGERGLLGLPRLSDPAPDESWFIQHSDETGDEA